MAFKIWKSACAHATIPTGLATGSLKLKAEKCILSFHSSEDLDSGHSTEHSNSLYLIEKLKLQKCNPAALILTINTDIETLLSPIC